MRYPYIGQVYSAFILFYEEDKGLVLGDVLGLDESIGVGDLININDGTNITREYLEGKCVKIESPEHSEFVQRLAFNAGFKWVDGDDRVTRMSEGSCLSFRFDKGMTFGFIDFEQITIPPPPKAFEIGEPKTAKIMSDLDAISTGYTPQDDAEVFTPLSECRLSVGEPKEWPGIGDEVEFPTGKGELVISKPDDQGIAIVKCLDSELGEIYKRVGIKSIKKPKTEVDILRDWIQERIGYGIASGFDCEQITHDLLHHCNITKKPQ